MLTEKSSKVVKKFYCETCDYNCCRKYDFDKHLSTRKQKMVTNGYKMVTKWLQNGYKMVTEKCQKSCEYFSL